MAARARPRHGRDTSPYTNHQLRGLRLGREVALLLQVRGIGKRKQAAAATERARGRRSDTEKRATDRIPVVDALIAAVELAFAPLPRSGGSGSGDP
jgi:hypothetical protein